MLQSKLVQLASTPPSRATRFMAMGVVVVAAACAALTAHAGGMSGPGHPHGMMMFGGHSSHMGQGMEHMLDGLGATDAQRAQIKPLAQAAAADLKTLHEGGRALHDKGLQLFAAPTVDAAAAEALRQQMQAHHDQVSKRMLQAMLDISKVLTPEQRAKLVERLKNRETRMHERMQREHGPQPKP